MFALECVDDDNQLYVTFIESDSSSSSASAAAASVAAVPPEYADLSSVFDLAHAEQLPPLRPGLDLEIDLTSGKLPRTRPLKPLSLPQMQALDEHLQAGLTSGKIAVSKAPYGAPIVFVQKHDGSLRVCEDYRELNSIAIKDKYPVPLVADLLARIAAAQPTVFTTLDMKNAFNQVRVKPGDEWKTSFQTSRGQFMYLVVPFGFCNSGAAFQRLMDQVLAPLCAFALSYFDDMIVFSRTPAEHTEHVRQLLETLRDNDLVCNPAKCQFSQHEVKFLGHILTPTGIAMDPAYLEAIANYPEPTTPKELQRAMGFLNFYRQFIRNYAEIAAPLSKIQNADRHSFVFGPAESAAFSQLKAAFLANCNLAHARYDAKFWIEADASNHALGAALLQADETAPEGTLVLRPVAYYSRKLTPAELNYPTHDHELLAVVEAVRRFKPFIAGSPHTLTIRSDHRNLGFFLQSQNWNPRQMRWFTELQDLNFKFEYVPGPQQVLSDALSRRSDYEALPEELASRRVSILTPQHFAAAFTAARALGPGEGILDEIREALPDDEYARRITTRIAEHEPGVARFTITDDLLYRDKLIYVPLGRLRTELLQLRHDTPLAGHFGITKTAHSLQREFWWPRLWDDVVSFVGSCDPCSRAKATHHAPAGLLRPLPVPDAPWCDISVDCITDLPASHGKTALLVVVDRFSKQAHFIPTVKELTSEMMASLLIDGVIKYHGIPKTMVSDRGPQFVARSWRRLAKLLQIDVKLSSAFHPETDGQTERANQIIEEVLRKFVGHAQNDWVDRLPMAEFAYNNADSSVTGVSPNFLITGVNARADGLSGHALQTTVVPSAEERIMRLRESHEAAREAIGEAQRRYKEQADTHRLPTIAYQVGDMVWLDRRNIKTTRSSNKLDSRRLGPFRVTEVINPVAVRLDLPPTMRIHPVFHASLLEPVATADFLGRAQPVPPRVEIDGHVEDEVDEVLEARVGKGKKVYFLVDWKGFGPEERSWEPEENLENAPEAVADFYRRYPNAPRSHKLGGSPAQRLGGGSVRVRPRRGT